VEALCRDGLLRRADVPGDQRGVNLSLTPEGEALLDGAEQRMVAAFRDVCARSGETAAAQAIASLAPGVDELERERHSHRRDTGPQSLADPRKGDRARDAAHP
jgi:DNA-binding MarR family transcriptional regulator